MCYEIAVAEITNFVRGTCKEFILAVAVSLEQYIAFLNIEFLYKPLQGLYLAFKNILFTESFIMTASEFGYL